MLSVWCTNIVMCMLSTVFCGRFFGSRYDDLDNLLGNSTLPQLATKLAHIATAIGRVSFHWYLLYCN